MVVIRTEFKELPECCEQCSYFGCRPHPYDGWMDLCELCGERIDGDGIASFQTSFSKPAIGCRAGESR